MERYNCFAADSLICVGLFHLCTFLKYMNSIQCQDREEQWKGCKSISFPLFTELSKICLIPKENITVFSMPCKCQCNFKSLSADQTYIPCFYRCLGHPFGHAYSFMPSTINPSLTNYAYEKQSRFTVVELTHLG
jgi:hypothetical protein